MTYVKTIVICALFLTINHVVSAQTSSADNLWLPSKYVEDVKRNKTFMNRGKYAKPIEAIFTKDGEFYFKTYLGRVAKANLEFRGTNRYEIKNVQANINRKFSSWDAYENYTFTVVRQSGTVLLLTKSPDSTSSDTTIFVAPVPKKFTAPLVAVEGYLLLQGNYQMVADGRQHDREEVSFDLDGNIVSSKWKSYKLTAASFLLEDKNLKAPSRFIVQLQDDKGNVEERVLLHYGGKELEFYKFTRNAKHGYVLDPASKTTLLSL